MEQSQNQLARILTRARIRKEYWPYLIEDFNFEGFSPADKEDILEYHDNLDAVYQNGLGFFFHGEFGTGKTMLSSIILKHAVKYKFQVFFITAFDFFEYYGAFGDQGRQFKDFVRNVHFLCIDEIGSEQVKTKDYVFALLDNLLVERQFPTIVTSNRKPDQLATIYGDHLSELLGKNRIREIGFSEVSKRDRRTWEKAIKNRQTIIRL